MKKKIFIAVLSLIMVLCGATGFAMLPDAPKAQASETETVYTLNFDGAEGSTAKTGAARTVDLASGESIIMEFTMAKNLEVASGFSGHGQGWTFYFNVGSLSSGSLSTSGKPYIFTRSGYNGAWFGNGSSQMNSVTPAALFSEGNAIKVVYTPSDTETANGSIIVYKKDTFVANASYETVISFSGLNSTVAPSTNVGLYMIAGWQIDMHVKNYSIKTSSGEDLGFTYQSSGNMLVSEYKAPSDVFDVSFLADGTTKRGYFGSPQAIDIDAGEKLVMEYDILSDNFTQNNYNLGFAIVSCENYVEDMLLANQPGYIYFAGNNVLTGTDYAFINDTQSQSNIAALGICDPLTARFDPYTVFNTYNSVKVVYTPYTSETDKGSIEVYTKLMNQPDSAYTLITSVTGIVEANAPRENVRIYTQLYKFASWVLNTEFNMQITNYSIYKTVSSGDKSSALKKMTSNSMCEVVCTPVKDKTVVEYTVHSYSGGYFGASESFKKTAGTKFAMEFSVLESDTTSGNCWIGFSYGTTVANSMYYSPKGKGGLMYFQSTAFAAGSFADNTPTTKLDSCDTKCEALWVFAAGKRLKGELDISDYKFRVYRKDIGAKAWGEPIAVWSIDSSSVADSFTLAMLVQNYVNMTLADINYTIDGVKKEFTITGNKFEEVDLSTTKTTDYAAILTANRKSKTEAGSLTYTYDNAIIATNEVSFRMIKNGGLKLKLKGAEQNSTVETEFDLSAYNKDYYMIKKVGDNFVLYGKALSDANYTALKTDTVNFENSSYYLSFYLENDTVYAKNAYIDDFAIDDGVEVTVYDFDRGLYECFTETAVGRSKASINYEYFTVTYFYADGTEVSVQKVGYGGAAKIPEGAFTNYEEIKAKSTFIENDVGIMLVRATDNFNYFTVTVTGGTLSNGKTSGAFLSGDSVTVTATLNSELYDQFSGWYDGEGNLLSSETSYTFVISDNVNLQARYETNVIRLTNGTFEDGTSLTYVKYGAVLKITADPAPSETDFIGWYDENGMLVANTAIANITVTGSTYYTAKYASTMVTATLGKFTLKDGVEIDETTVVTKKGVVLTVVADAPGANELFLGWYDESGELLSTQATYQFTVEKNVNLVARYGPVQVLVIAVNGRVGNDNKDGADDGVKYVDYRSEVVIAPVIPEFKTFVGWYNSEDVLVSTEERFTFYPEVDVSYTAKFTDAFFSVSVVNGTVNGKPADSIVYNGSVTVTANNAGVGRRFVGWYQGQTKVSEEVSYTFTVTGNITLTAVYENLPYQLSVTDGVVVDAKDIYYYGDIISVRANAKEGYNFIGWYSGETLVSEIADYTFTLTGDTALVAKFAEVEDSSSGGCKNQIGGGNIVIISITVLSALALIIARKNKGGKRV